MKNEERKAFSKIGWTQQEEQELKRIAQKIGNNRWTQISKELNKKFPHRLRTNKQCRERFTHYIKLHDADADSKQWGMDQLKQLLSLTAKVGTKWSIIHKHMPLWSQNFLKNKFNGILHRLLRKVANVCRSKSKHPCKQVQFNTLVRILDFCQDGQEHSQEALRCTRETQIKILEEAIKVQYGTDEFESMKELEEKIHCFTTLNRAYLMSMGKKRSLVKKTRIPLQEYVRQQDEGQDQEDQDNGFHNVIIIKMSSCPKVAEQSNKSFSRELQNNAEKTKSISQFSRKIN